MTAPEPYPRKKSLLRLLARGLALTVPIAGFIGLAFASTNIVIVSWGGTYAESQTKAYFEPYLKVQPDVRITLLNTSGDSVNQLRLMDKTGGTSWDLVDVSAADAIRLCREGLAIPINHDELLAPAPDGAPATQDFGQTIVSECFIPQIVYSTTIGYRVDKLKPPPTNICDLFDLVRFPGKRALEKRPINNLEWALICDGVPAEQVYEVLDTEEGVERALRKLDTIREHVVWWVDGAETPNLLAKGQVVMGSAYNGRLFPLAAAKKPKVAILWDRQVFDFDGWIIPKGAPNRLAAEKFVRFATDTQRLADQAQYIPYGPARRSSSALIGRSAQFGVDMKPFLPTTPENAKTTLLYNYDWWASHRDRLDQRFKVWLGPDY